MSPGHCPRPVPRLLWPLPDTAAMASFVGTRAYTEPGPPRSRCQRSLQLCRERGTQRTLVTRAAGPGNLGFVGVLVPGRSFQHGPSQRRSLRRLCSVRPARWAAGGGAALQEGAPPMASEGPAARGPRCLPSACGCSTRCAGRGPGLTPSTQSWRGGTSQQRWLRGPVSAGTPPARCPCTLLCLGVEQAFRLGDRPQQGRVTEPARGWPLWSHRRNE